MLLNNLTKKSSVLAQKYNHILSVATKQIDTALSTSDHSRDQIDVYQAPANKFIEDELVQFENNLRTLQGQRDDETKTIILSNNFSNLQGNHPTISERSFGGPTSLPDKTAVVTAGRFRKYSGTWIPKPMGSLIT